MAKHWLKILMFTVFCSSACFSQGKIKGNKNIVAVETKIDDFNTIRFGEKFKIELIQDDKASVEIEADENLHEYIEVSVNNGVLQFNTSAKIQSKKALNITVRFTDALNKIEVNNDAEISTKNTIRNDSIQLIINDYARAFLNIRNKHFKLINNNKSTFGISSKTKLNITSDIVILELSENSKTEALINTDSLQSSLYKSAFAKLEGDVDYLQVNTITSSNFSAKKLTSKTCDITTEDSSHVTIQVLNNLNIETSGSSKVYLYGDPKINLIAFKDSSTFYKKEL